MACNENTIFHPANRAIANPNRMPARIPDHTADTAHDDRLDQKLPENLRRVAPTALRIPISWIRCVTLASMMFMIPMPPTRSEIAAIAASTMLKVAAS